MRAFRKADKSKVVRLEDTINPVPNKEPVQMKLELSKLFFNLVEIPYQRDPEARLSWLKKHIANRFNLGQIGEFYVSARGDGRYAIIDGGGRYYVMTTLLPEYRNAIVPCLVWEGLTLAEESAIFAAQREKKNLSPVDFFNSDVYRGVPEAIEIKKVMDDFGLRVGAQWPRGIQSVPYIYATHRMGVLARTIVVLKNTCKEVKLSGGQFASLAIFIHAAGRGLNEARLRKIMINHGGPDWFEIQVKAGNKGVSLHPRDLQEAIAKYITRVYNQAIKNGKLDPDKIALSAASFNAKIKTSDN